MIRKFIMAVKINNQKGFATLEIIFIMLIISILAGSVIPKISRSLDTVQLDYETKKFIGEFYLAKSLNRTANYSANKFFNLDLDPAHPVQIDVHEKFYYLKRNTSEIGDRNYLAKGMKFSDSKVFQFNDEEDYYRGSSVNMIFKSRLGRNSELVVDSVGRIRKKS